MAKYQVFLALLAVSVAMAAPSVQVDSDEDQNAEDTVPLLYGSAPYHSSLYRGRTIISPYAYQAAVPNVVAADRDGRTIISPYAYQAAAPYTHVRAVEPIVQYVSPVQYLDAPAAYHYAPASYGYGQEQVHPTGYSYSHVSRNW